MRRGSLLLAMLLAGCQGIQSATGADGRQGEIFTGLFWFFLAVTLFVALLVFAFLAVAIFRRHEPEEEQAERPLNIALIGWTAFIAVGLTVLTLASWITDRRLARAAESPALHINVTAHQWWWEVEYSGAEPWQSFRTANELHLPVGVPARITLRTGDVIHSFWVPNLAGKQDLIPGRENEITLTPQRVGQYRGQCAEFCGLQHARMALDVTVEPGAVFEAWRRRQLMPAPPPNNPVALAGYNYVTTRECASCHNIAGTPASGRVAPDLTHLASRRSIGAGTFPMTRGHLYAWIADPQTAKPGNYMPHVGLEPAELHAVVAYLETLR